jgi:uncharacterized protein YraI
VKSLGQPAFRPIHLVSCAAIGAAVLGGYAPSARATSAPIHITETVNIRPGPSTASGNPLGAIPTGASPDYYCFVWGQDINGVPIWFNVTYNGITGYYASYYDDSSYHSNEELTAKYGVPLCGAATPQPAAAPSPTGEPSPGSSSPSSSPSPPPESGAVPAPVTTTPLAPGPTHAEQSAIAWARPYASRHSSAYDGMCLAFVFKAYAAAGLNLRPWVAVSIGYGTYPQDIWGHFKHGISRHGTPPPGALVFFRSGNSNRVLSHVALSVGGGGLISTADRVANYVHYESVAQHRYDLGWWLPDR